MKEAHYNLAAVPPNVNALDICKEIGIQATVYDHNISYLISNIGDYAKRDYRDVVDEFTAKFAEHPALYSVFIMDEPDTDQFLLLAEVHSYILEKIPDARIDINIFPNYGSPSHHLKAKDYDDYLDRYIKTIKPQMICFDNYPFIKHTDKVTGETMTVRRKGFFQNLESVRKASLKYDLPFMNVIATLVFWDKRFLTEAEYRWQVFHSIAYGTKGLSSFTYATPECHEESSQVSPGIIDFKGLPTVHYSIVKKVNAEMLVVGNILLKMNCFDVFHVGEEVDNVKKFTPDATFKDITGGDFTVGEFDQGYVMIVNKDFVKASELRFTIQSGKTVYMINKNTGIPQNISNNSGEYEITIEAGDGLLFKI
jgi:hypothetical protein